MNPNITNANIKMETVALHNILDSKCLLAYICFECGI
jgi:hypothetical protein